MPKAGGSIANYMKYNAALTTKEKAAAEWYADRGAGAIHSYTEYGYAKSEVESNMPYLLSALDKGKLTRDVTVYMGGGIYSKGNNSLSSVSLSREIAAGFAYNYTDMTGKQGIIYKFTLPKGTRAIDVSNIVSGGFNESELLVRGISGLNILTNSTKTIAYSRSRGNGNVSVNIANAVIK